MKKNNQSGFSLIELLCVVVIVGIIAAVALPYLMKAKYASENASMYATLRTMSSAQIDFFARNARYATLSELNSVQNNSYGTTSGENINRGNFVLDMGSVTTTDPSLRSNFTITATKSVGSNSNDMPYIISVNATGRISQVTP